MTGTDSMTIVDAHIHLQDNDLAPDVLAEGDRLGVDLFICSSIAGYRHYPYLDGVRKSNDDMYAVTQRHSGRVAAYCYVNPRHGADALTDMRRRIEDQGMIGVKLWVATLADDRLVDPIVEQAIAYRAPMLVHAWRKTVGQLPYESTAAHIARLAARYPEARIIMAHLGGQVESAMNSIAPYPNVLTDTSGTPVGGSEVAIAVQRLGADRVVFGSDAHGGCIAANIGKVLGAGLSTSDQEKVLGGTMTRLLREVVR